jgi:hypothetical protein
MVFRVFVSPSKQVPDRTLYQTTAISIQISSKLIIRHHPSHSTLYTLMAVPLNKPQINKTDWKGKMT